MKQNYTCSTSKCSLPQTFLLGYVSMYFRASVILQRQISLRNLSRSTTKTTKCEILFYMVLYSTRSFTLARNNWYIASKTVNIAFKCHCKLFTPLNTLLFIGCFHYILASSFFKSKKSTCETRKNGFSYTSKALFILKKIKF